MQSKRRPVAIQLGLIAGTLAGPIFLIADTVDAATRPHYEPLRQWVSHLSLGSAGWVGVTILVATALLLGLYAATVLVIAGRGSARVLPTAVLVAAVALLAAAVFPIDPSLGFPADVPPPPIPTATGQIHQASGPVFILALAVAAFWTGRFLGGLGITPRWVGWSWISGTVVIVAFAVCSVLVGMDYAGVIPSAWSGLFERVAIDVGLLWTSWVAATVLRERAKPVTGNDPHTEPVR